MRYALWLWWFIGVVAVTGSLMAAPGQAATYHVQQTGSSDGNPCTAGAPCLTIGRGLSVMAGGDTLIIHGGNYAEGDLIPPNGSQGSPTRLQAAPGETPIIGGTQPSEGIFTMSTRHDVTLDGLTLDGQQISNFTVYAADGNPAPTRNTIINCEIRYAYYSGMIMNGTNWTIENNYIHHNALPYPTSHGIYFSAAYSTIRHNVFAANARHNIQIFAGPNPTDNILDGNIFTASGCGVTLTHGLNHLFINNVIYDDGLGCGGSGGNGLAIYASGSKIYNNTFVRNSVITVNEGDNSSVQIRNNILTNASISGESGGDSHPSPAQQSSNFFGDPGYQGATDFQLVSGSSAIDVGESLSEVTTDLLGVARPYGNGYDLGAYEYTGGTPPPVTLRNPPRNLRVLSAP